MNKLRQILVLMFVAVLASCAVTSPASQQAQSNKHQVSDYVKVNHPTWLKDAVIYQINTRQFTPEGTFSAATEQLERLHKLGVDILWLMPIHPIGEINRKGSLGSPYSIKDYFAVNPEFGTEQDLKAFVDKAHQLGMYVILDWVANHTAWDNEMKLNHPEWYERDYKGDFTSTPWYDWADIIDLDFNQPELRQYMAKAMRYWVEDIGIDGYRCDAAGLVPLQFWTDVRHELEQIKPVFMLAEWEGKEFHEQAFDATYAWSWWQAVHDIAKGKKDVNALYNYYSWNTGYYPPMSMRLTYISNHDVNAWEATQFEAFADALPAAIVLSVVGEGLPMIYNGQEAGNAKRLEFFERDPIKWQPHPIGDLYQQVFALKKQNSVLWNGKWGAPMQHVPNTQANQVLSFVRQNQQQKLFAVFNFSAQPQKVRFAESLYQGNYVEYFTQTPASLSSETELTLAPWSYRVFVAGK